jgi:DNA-binding transcriptional ArsR family regulator
MFDFHFGVEDLARLRFAISPMFETISSMVALRDPASAATHLPWVERTRGNLQGLDLGAALTLAVPTGYIPDFVTPPPTTPVASMADELELLRATPREQVEHDMGLLLGGRRPPAALRELVEDPMRGIARLADALEAYWERAIAPDWPRVRALLQADISYRAQCLTETGPAALFGDLNQRISWSEDTLHVAIHFDEDIELEGQGMVFVPSAFSWSRVLVVEPPLQPTVIYPARGIALLWQRGVAAPDGLARALGASRATLLMTLDAPASTTDLAARLELSAGGISQHLGALRDAGLVTGTREGRTVLYARTPAADALVDAVAA